jgi:hypothetical protein
MKGLYKNLGYPKKKNYKQWNELALTATVSENVSGQHDDEDEINNTKTFYTISSFD